MPHLSEFQKTVMAFWQRVVTHSNIFKDTDWNYFFDLTSLSTILIAQTLGHIITTEENDLKVIHDVPREERHFLKSKLFENGLEESCPENGSLSKSSYSFKLKFFVVLVTNLSNILLTRELQ